MSAPNLTTVATITGNSNVMAVTTTYNSIASNPASSNKVYKIDTLICANVDGANAAVFSAAFVRSSTPYRIAYNVVIPAQATLMVVGKDSPIYLQEGDSLQLVSASNLTVEATASFEVMQ